IIGPEICIRLITIQPEANQTQPSFSQQGRAKGVGVVRRDVLAASVACLWTQAANGCSTSLVPEKRRVVQQRAEISVTCEEFVVVGDIGIIAHVKLILV